MCPVPLRHATIQLAHGGGGRLMRELLEQVFLPAFACPPLAARHDSAVLPAPRGRLALTTDGYVVSPRFFPGGDIGKLAVFGTVNDLAMAGARPLYLTASFLLEEGLPIEELCRIVASMRDAAREAGVSIVTGDTKVVDRGKGDGVFITTAGAGDVPDGVHIAPAQVRPGDVLLVSGDLGRHGVAVMSVREGLAFEGDVASDCAPLHGLVAALLEAGVEVRCLRDLTRGGLASALNEVALDAGLDVELDERAVPVGDVVAGACELLGLDALHVACEGRLCAFVSEASSERALAVMRAHPAACGPAIVGRVRGRLAPGRVVAIGRLGARRSLDLLSGEQLPRIC